MQIDTHSRKHEVNQLNKYPHTHRHEIYIYIHAYHTQHITTQHAPSSHLNAHGRSRLALHVAYILHPETRRKGGLWVCLQNMGETTKESHS